MHIGCDRNLEVAADRLQNFATFARSRSANGAQRSPGRFVLRALEDKTDISRRTALRDLTRHPPDKLLGLNHARPEDKPRPSSANRDFANPQRLPFSHDLSGKQERRNFKGFLPAFLLSSEICLLRDRQSRAAR